MTFVGGGHMFGLLRLSTVLCSAEAAARARACAPKTDDADDDETRDILRQQKRDGVAVHKANCRGASPAKAQS